MADYIFDIDGTLASAAHRLHLIEERPDRAKDWETFLSAEMVMKDEPISPVWEVLEALNSRMAGGMPLHRILFITGRKEAEREATLTWMEMHTIHDVRIMPLYMRSNGDRRPSEIVKEEGLMRARADGYRPVMVFEDRKSDTAMWRRNGLLCAQVAEGDF